MSTTEEAVRTALESLEETGEADDNLIDDPAPNDPPIEEPEFQHKTHEQWIAEGNDPDDYRGKNAFDKFGKKNYELKEIKQQMLDSQEQIKTLTDATLGMRDQYQREADERVSRARTEIQAEVDQARKDDDLEAFENASNRLNQVGQTAAPQQSGLLPNIVEFIRRNPVLDKNSPDFNETVFGDWCTAHDNNLDSLLGGDRSKQEGLKEDQVNRSMAAAMRSAKMLSPDRFSSPRNKRKTPPVSRNNGDGKSKGNYESRLKTMGSTSLYSQGENSGLEMYKHIRDKMKNPKGADKYAAQLLGDTT